MTNLALDIALAKTVRHFLNERGKSENLASQLGLSSTQDLEAKIELLSADNLTLDQIQKLHAITGDPTVFKILNAKTKTALFKALQDQQARIG